MSDAAASDDISRSRPFVRALLIALIAFLAGLAAMAWLLGQWPQGGRLLGLVPPPAPRPIVVVPPRAVLPVAPGDVAQRIVSIETRLDRVDQASRQAVGNADRAEGLLVAFAARRALDRGVALGYIEGLLRERFAQTQRPAVATIITAARRPVTLEQLQQRLVELGPDLTAAAPGDSWLTALRRELSGLITIRREGSTSTVPGERLARARPAGGGPGRRRARRGAPPPRPGPRRRMDRRSPPLRRRPPRPRHDRNRRAVGSSPHARPAALGGSAAFRSGAAGRGAGAKLGDALSERPSASVPDRSQFAMGPL